MWPFNCSCIHGIWAYEFDVFTLLDVFTFLDGSLNNFLLFLKTLEIET